MREKYFNALLTRENETQLILIVQNSIMCTIYNNKKALFELIRSNL